MTYISQGRSENRLLPRNPEKLSARKICSVPAAEHEFRMTLRTVDHSETRTEFNESALNLAVHLRLYRHNYMY